MPLRPGRKFFRTLFRFVYNALRMLPRMLPSRLLSPLYGSRGVSSAGAVEGEPHGNDIHIVSSLLSSPPEEHASSSLQNAKYLPIEELLCTVLDGENTASDPEIQDLVDSLQAVEYIAPYGDEAADKYFLLQKLESLANQGHESKQPLIRVLGRLIEKTGKLPKQLFLHDVDCPDRRTYGLEKGIDIFCGTLGRRKVSIKHLRVFRMVIPSQRLGLEKTFFREAVAWYNLSHEFVLPFFGVIDVPELGGICMVSPWMENGNVRQFLDLGVETGELLGVDFVKTVNKLLYQISLGLEYLHEQGVVHGELRGAHIYISDTREVQIGDFGLSSIVEACGEYSTSLQGGPTAWLAPELIEPEKYGFESSKSTKAADAYSFGCLCVELYSRQSPFEGLTDFKIATKVLRGDRPKRPTLGNHGIPDPLWELVTRCWKEDSAGRPTSSEISRRLQPLLQSPSS